MERRLILALIAGISISFFSSATDRVSTTSGFWGTAGTWSPSGVPAAGDNVTIVSGHIISMNANGSCNHLTINGNANWTANRTVNVGGNLTLNNGGSITGSGSTGSFNISGTMTVPSGAAATIGRTDLSVSGSLSLTGTLTINNVTGAKSFTDITINSGGVWNATVAEDFNINGSITDNGTFTANTGLYTLAGASKSLSGSSTIIFNSVSISGTYTNNGTAQVNVNISGGGTLTQGSGATLIIGDPTPGGSLVASASGNTVRYLVSSGDQSVVATTYDHLVFENTGTGNTDGRGIYTVNGDLDVVDGTCDIGSLTLNGNLNISAGAVVNLRSSPVLNGSVNIDGTLNIVTTPGTKTVNDLFVSSTGTWNSAVAENYTVNGNISCSGTFTSNTGIYTLAGTGKTISGTLSINRVNCTGSYTNNATLSVISRLYGVGTFSQGATGTLNMGATSANFTVNTFNASASGNTVNYNLAGAQNVRVPSDGSYHHLTLGGSGTKTLVAATDVNGNVSISSALSAANFNMTVGGNWSNTGTVFTPGTNTVTFDGAAQSISRTGGETFNHVVCAGSGVKTLGSAITVNGNITISSSLDVSASNYGMDVKGTWTNNGTFIPQNGTVTFSGTASQSIAGTAVTGFKHIAQTNSAGVSLAQNANLFGGLTISGGAFITTGYAFTIKSNASGTGYIAPIPGGCNFYGNIIMERYTGTGPTDWRFLCSNVSGLTLADWNDDIYTSGFPGSDAPSFPFVSIYTYDETQPGDLNAYGFVPASNITNPITTGKGYWVYLGPTPVTLDVSGPPGKFSQSPAITYTNSGDINNDGWNMVANPYPSAIDWDNASWTKTSLDDAVYIYNSYTGSFASYVAGIGVNGGSNFIPSSQAFWVKANGASPALTAVENVKTSSDNTFLKQELTPNTSRYPMAFGDFPVPLNTNSVPNSIKLVVSRNNLEDETYIRFTQGATNDFDNPYDAWKLQNLDTTLPNLSTVIHDTSDLSINSMQELTSDISIPVRLTVSVPGTYTIRRDSILMLPMSSCILLEDLATGNTTDLKSTVSYSFTISDTTKAPRFILHVSAPVSKQSVSTGCTYDSTGVAVASGPGTGPWNYIWMNSNGDTLKITTGLAAPDTLSGLPVGTYTVEVSGSICGTVRDTIEIKSASLLSVLVNYSDVTCSGNNDGFVYSAVSGGIAPLSFLWSTGQSTSSVSGLGPGTYSVTVTDGGGCSQTQFAIIQEPLPVVAGFMAGTDTVDLSTGNSVTFSDTSSGALYYSWDFGDTTVPDTAASPTHFFTYAGTYTVTQVISNGFCSDTAYFILVAVDSLLNTSAPGGALPGSYVNVFYSDANIYIAFSLPAKTDAVIHLCDPLGRKISTRICRQVQFSKINLGSGDLPAGLYTAVIETESGRIARKVIVPR